MSNENSQRKQRLNMTSSMFSQIKRLYKLKTRKELMEITSLSKAALNVAIRKIESYANGDATFNALYKSAGRKRSIKDALNTEIRSLMGNDNSLTQVGCRERLQNSNISLSTMCRAVKEAGLSRKRLKRRSNVVLSEEHRASRVMFCAKILGLRSKQILFLDESGFNLHTSTQYGYSPVGQDAFIYQPKSRGRNVSLCSIISLNGMEHFNIVDGAFNREIFIAFLEECFRNGVFQSNTVLVMDNVRFHCGQEVSDYLFARGVQVIMLPTYSPDLNPLENLFACIKYRLDRIRPRSQTREGLKENIRNVIYSLGTLNEYYNNFWQHVNLINNKQEE